MKTRADFLRDAKKGLGLRVAVLWGMTKEEILSTPEENQYVTLKRRITQGVFDIFRKVTKVQTNGVSLEGSFLEIPSASRMEYTGDRLRLYAYGYTPMTEEELKVMAEWKLVTDTKEYQERAYLDVMTDGGQTFWQQKIFFRERNAEQLLGYDDFHNGRRLDMNRFVDGEVDCILDNKVRGKLEFEYEVKQM